MSTAIESPGTTGQSQAQAPSAVVGSPTGAPTEPSQSPSGDSRVAGTEQQPIREEAEEVGNLTWKERATEWQSTTEKLKKQVGPLLARIESGQITAEGIDGVLTRTAQMLEDPVLGDMMRQYVQTGKVEAPAAQVSADDDDPFEDESTKVLRGQVEQLTAQVQQLTQGNAQTSQTLAMQKIAESADAFMKEYEGLTAEEMAQFQSRVTERVAVMARTQPQTILNMDAETFKAIGLPVLTEVIPLPTLGERQLQRKQGQLNSAATDGALTVATTGQEPAARAAATGMNVEALGRAAMERFFAAHGRGS